MIDKNEYEKATVHPTILASVAVYSGKVEYGYMPAFAEMLTGSVLIVMLPTGGRFDDRLEERAAARALDLGAESAEVWSMGERDGQPTIARVSVDAIKRAVVEAELLSLGDAWG